MTYKPPATIAKFVAKLERRSPFAPVEREALLALATETRTYGAFQDIVREGEHPMRCAMIEEGVVSRSKVMRSGARQILSFHIPGDMVDLPSALVMTADHSINAHNHTVIVSVAHDDLLALAARFPAIGRALWFDTLADAAIFREWTINVGRRTARERTSHLLLEFATRLDAIGGLVGNTFQLPITQTGMADALGLTHVHTNRTLQWLRAQRFIRTLGRAVTIENWQEMRALSGFNPAYLNPEGPRLV